MVGFRGRSPVPDGWNLVELDKARVMTLNNPRILGLAYLGSRVALGFFWQQVGNRYIFEKAREGAFDLMLAHDYVTAPIAARLAEVRSVPFGVDVHEYARAQFSMAGNLMRSILWSVARRPYIDALSRACYSKAALVTTVCDGIADLLQADYGLGVRPTVVRGTPVYQSMPFNLTGQVIRILYHGLLVPTRGLEQAIASVKLWRPEFRLVIRGVGEPGYIASLRSLTECEGVADRVQFEPPVPFTDLVAAANACDVGYVVLENYSPQREFTLPNKFFEYIMAGLALCVSDLPEIARIVKNHDLGLLVGDTKPRSIAAAINSLTPERIDVYKRRSLAAARELCWERESAVLIQALQGSIPAFAQRTRPAGSNSGSSERPGLATA